jgi:hypothetical protein
MKIIAIIISAEKLRYAMILYPYARRPCLSPVVCTEAHSPLFVRIWASNLGKQFVVQKDAPHLLLFACFQ